MAFPSGPHRRHRRLGPEDQDHPLEIVVQDVEAELRSNPFEGSGLDVGGAHPAFEGSGVAVTLYEIAPAARR